MGEEWKMAALEEGVVSIASLVSMAGLVDGIRETMPTRMVQNVDSILAWTKTGGGQRKRISFTVG
jgi:hypothetical protein